MVSCPQGAQLSSRYANVMSFSSFTVITIPLWMKGLTIARQVLEVQVLEFRSTEVSYALGRFPSLQGGERRVGFQQQVC